MLTRFFGSLFVEILRRLSPWDMIGVAVHSASWLWARQTERPDIHGCKDEAGTASTMEKCKEGRPTVRLQVVYQSLSCGVTTSIEVAN